MRGERKGVYINYTVKKEKKACSITILPRCSHQINIVVLYKHVSHSIVIDHWILRLWITLQPDQTKIKELNQYINNAFLQTIRMENPGKKKKKVKIATH